jgi:hypothetical protein
MIGRVQRKRLLNRDAKPGDLYAGARTPRVKRKPKRVVRTRVKLPPAKESGDSFTGARGCALRQGTHVRYPGGKLTGTIQRAGAQQCEVKWHLSGVTQAEITSQLMRIT